MCKKGKESIKTMVNLISKFCAVYVCKKCLIKKRRDPENEKQFVRICVDCENLHLRKILFEEFWNEKLRKEKDIFFKKEEIKMLKNKIYSRELELQKRQVRKSELKMSTKLLDDIDEKIKLTQKKIKNTNEKEIKKTEEQLKMTDDILKKNKQLKNKEETFLKLKNQKDFFKSQQFKDMHRKQDLKLKIKFFLDKVIDKNEIVRNSILLVKRKSSSDINLSKLKPTFSQVSLSEPEKKKLNKNKKKYRQKNKKLDDESTICGGCKGCIIF